MNGYFYVAKAAGTQDNRVLWVDIHGSAFDFV
jgi:hypothetical protein